MMYLMVLGGFVLLFGGGEWLVRGAVGVARRLKISPLLIGLTIVAFCTSAPELLVSLEAATQGQPDISIGNVVGSNIANVLLILGAASLIWPIKVDRHEIRRDLWVMLASVSLLAGLGMTGQIEGWHGGLMVGLLIAYVWYSYWTEKYRGAPSAGLHEEEADEFEGATQRLWLALVYLALGLGALIIGSKMLVSGAEEIARSFGVSEAVIGLTMVALGTSLPELATALIAAARKHSDVAVGAVVGSNIFNVLSILGITALVKPIPFSAQIASFDVWIMIGASALLVPLLMGRGRIGRLSGALFLAGYAGYILYVY